MHRKLQQLCPPGYNSSKGPLCSAIPCLKIALLCTIQTQGAYKYTNKYQTKYKHKYHTKYKHADAYKYTENTKQNTNTRIHTNTAKRYIVYGDGAEAAWLIVLIEESPSAGSAFYHLIVMMKEVMMMMMKIMME